MHREYHCINEGRQSNPKLFLLRTESDVYFIDFSTSSRATTARIITTAWSPQYRVHARSSRMCRHTQLSGAYWYVVCLPSGLANPFSNSLLSGLCPLQALDAKRTFFCVSPFHKLRLTVQSLVTLVDLRLRNYPKRLAAVKDS